MQLDAILEQARRRCLPDPNLEALRPGWEAHISRVRQQVPEAYIASQGEVVYLGELSPGCRACKAGTWDCVFTTLCCNLDCDFCYSPPQNGDDSAGSAFGRTPEEIAYHHAQTRITGISFSGGEPFIDPDRLCEWVAWFKSRYPDKYYWVYTNGLLAAEEHLKRLGLLGVDEVRFNVAATGYDDPLVMKHLAAAARHLPTVTIEVPAIPEHKAKLLACLELWCGLGVSFLNLHELIYEPGTNSAARCGLRQTIVTPDGHASAFNPASRAVTLCVMKTVRAKRLPLAVNDCSMQSKLRQLRGRRRNLAPLVQAPHERLVAEQFYESYCAYRDANDWRLFHPDATAEMRQRFPDHQLFRLVRIAPLSLHEQDRWITAEALPD